MSGTSDAFVYELTLEFDDGDGARTYTFESKDGLSSKKSIRVSERKLLDHIEPATDDDVLVPDANYGVTGVVLGRSAGAGTTVMVESSARAVDCCRTNSARNGVENATVELRASIAEVDGEFDLVAHAPKAYAPPEVVKQKISDGLSRLSPGGSYYLATSNDDVAQKYASALDDLTGRCRRVAHDDGCYVFRAECPEGYEPWEYVSEREYRATVDDYTCRFLTVPGLFSAAELDDGTEALLRHATVEDGSRVLDCCCGYGAIGAFVGARTDCELWATDDDAVATVYAEKNLERNGVTPEAVVTDDCLDDVRSETFDFVLSNPPTHAGKGLTTKLFSQIRDVLGEDGEFWLVANRIMGYDEVLESDFDFETTVAASVDKYDVVLARPT